MKTWVFTYLTGNPAEPTKNATREADYMWDALVLLRKDIGWLKEVIFWSEVKKEGEAKS